MKTQSETEASSPRPFGLGHGPILVALALAAAITYLPFAALPPLQDDYGHVWLAEKYGGPSGWGALLGDPLYRCRATSLMWTAATLQLFGYSNLAFHLSGILLHAINAWLLYALGSCRWVGWRVSAAAALVFAVRERPHEAVIWYASIHELLVFAFVLLAVLAWVRWLEGGSRWWWAAVGAAWVLALASKESGILLAGLLPVFALCYPGRRKAAGLVLALGIVSTAAYFLWAFSQRAQHLHFHDGTFLFGAHFLRTALNSAARGLWVWGGLSLATLWVCRARVERRVVVLALAWFSGALLPYLFLTYMPRIPSRHHYLASGGAALLIGAAGWAAVDGVRRPRLAASCLVAVFLLHNWTYLWTYKHAQFVQRAELLEGLLRAVQRQPGGPVVVRCREVLLPEARLAVHYRLHWDGAALVRPDEAGAPGRPYFCPGATGP